MTTGIQQDRPHNRRARPTAPSVRPSKTDLPPTLLQLFEDFDDAGLGWALARPWEGLFSSEGDIDILVARSAMREARAILLHANFIEMRSDGSGCHAASLDPVSGRFLWVHLQPAVKLGDLTIDASKLLDDIRRDPLPEIAPDWLMWILLLRAIEKQHAPERYRERLSRLASEWQGGPDEIEQLLRNRGIDPAALVAATAAGDWEYIVSQNLPFPDAKGEKKSFAKNALKTGRRIRSLFAKPRTGLCVAVIGPDGAGKSTLVTGLLRTLPLRSRSIYMGLTGGRMRRAQSLRIPGLIFSAQVAVLWARYAQALLRRADGQIVLFERYVLDGAVSAGTPLSPLQNLSRRLQRWIVPSVDLVLLLDASGRTMFDRKGEYAPETLEDWRTQYLKLKASVRNLVVIDAEQPADAVLRAAQTAIWDRLRERAAA